MKLNLNSGIYKSIVGILFMLFLFSCNQNKEMNQKDVNSETEVDIPGTNVDSVLPYPDPSEIHSNQRFRNVTVENVNNQTIKVSGEAQIFEATLSWVIEDGHNELKSGFQTTSAGAPEWGKFDFNIDLPPHQPNTSQHLILFESSAEDGSQQHELIIKIR
jgi:hypothetical protein